MDKVPQKSIFSVARPDPNGDLHAEIAALEKEIAQRRAKKTQKNQIAMEKSQIDKQWEEKKKDLEILIYQRADKIQSQISGATRIEALISAATEQLESVQKQLAVLPPQNENIEVTQYGFELVASFFRTQLLNFYREQEQSKKTRERLDDEQGRRLAVERRLEQMRAEFASAQHTQHSRLLEEIAKARAAGQDQVSLLLDMLTQTALERKIHER